MFYLLSHHLTERRAVLFGFIFSFVFIFATSAFAETTSRPMQMEVDGAAHSQDQAVSSEIVETPDCQKYADRKDCCDNEDEIPCSDDIGCTTLCSSSSLSPVISRDIGYQSPIQAETEFAYDQFAICGIFVHLNPPPPRS
jgi:hypothetical protein